MKTGKTEKKSADDCRSVKRVYEKPAIISREHLEVVAAVCTPGKSIGTPIGMCTIIQGS
ncbi:MAG: hypothetical protein GXP09_08155 [Gammaproteobacteria bacterium]|nr:hypothetical protein [Gammaproteobacteria bacterium]